MSVLSSNVLYAVTEISLNQQDQRAVTDYNASDIDVAVKKLFNPAEKIFTISSVSMWTTKIRVNSSVSD